MSSISVTAELQLLSGRQLQYLLESCANLHQRVLAATCLTSRSCPKTNSVKSFSNVDDHAHNLVVSFVFKSLSDGSQLSV